MLLSADKYDMTQFILDIQKKHIDINDKTLNMEIFGYLNEVLGDIGINSILMATEWGNEAFPIRANFEKSLLTYAVTYNIQNLNASPATMQVMLCFITKDLETIFKNNNTNTVVIDKDNPIMINDLEFHLDYNINIRKNIINGSIVYTALYDMSEYNPVSNIDNEYLPTPIYFSENNDYFIAFSVDIRQYHIEEITTKCLNNDYLINRTLDFTIPDNQLAAFKVSCIDGDKETNLTPIVDGLPLDGENLYCYYTYIDASNIRLIFDKDSYAPSANTNIIIKVYTTSGEKGNFDKGNTSIIFTINSSTGQYNSLPLLIKPITGSMNGINRKSMEDLKEIIPKEILSRGTITCEKDLENYFNSLDENRLLFYKRINNQKETLYYAYLLAKDSNDDIVPTNTIKILASPEYIDSLDQEAKDNNRYVIKAGTPLDYTNGIGHLMTEEEINNMELNNDNKYPKSDGTIKVIDFLYCSPITFVINRNPISSSYYLDIIDRTTYLKFKYINTDSVIQFISHSINTRKVFLEGTEYNITMNITQNIQSDFKLIEMDENKNIISSKIKPVLVFTNGPFSYYKFGEIISMDNTYTYGVKFIIDTKGYIDEDNNIRIEDLYEGGKTGHGYVYLPEEVETSIYLYVEDETATSNSREKADLIIPNMDGYILTNIYTLKKPFNFFYNYSDVIKSNVKWTSEGTESNGYTLDGVPVVKYNYLHDINKCFDFINYIHYRKTCIDDALKELEEPFGIDFKFFNTYGPSKMFTIGYEGQYLDRVNISVKFVVKLAGGVDDTIVDDIKYEIKFYIEDINTINDIHMSNLLTKLKTKFNSDIEFIDFVGINNYNALYKYIQRIDVDYLNQVPEFLSINNNDKYEPDIDIKLL